jgi:hypothetical protein
VRKPTVLDWLGATAGWFAFTLFLGVLMSEGIGFDEEVGVGIFFTLFFGGIAAARIWWLRRPEDPKAGLTTGEAQMTRLEELEMRMMEMESMHQRLAEVEDRLDFSERLLASSSQRQPLERHDA